jgi:hypothetical protein
MNGRPEHITGERLEHRVVDTVARRLATMTSVARRQLELLLKGQKPPR